MTGADPLANLYDREVACASCEYEAAEIQMFIGWTTCPVCIDLGCKVLNFYVSGVVAGHWLE